MATEAQVLANRFNARKSTGPRTPEGKGVVSQNAVKHGLSGREAVIAGEDPEEFERYREGMLEELAPAGAVEAMLAERVVGLSWRLRRAQRLQTAAFAAGQEFVAPAKLASFGADTVPEGRARGEGVSSLKCQVSSAESPVSSDGSDFTLPTSHFELAKITPDGVTTNGRVEVTDPSAAAPASSCKTKPIVPGPGDAQVPCGKEVMNDSAENGLGKTKPICGGQGDPAGLLPPPPDADRAPTPGIIRQCSVSTRDYRV